MTAADNMLAKKTTRRASRTVAPTVMRAEPMLQVETFHDSLHQYAKKLQVVHV